MADYLEELSDRRTDWVAAVNDRDIDAYVNLLATDAVWLPPGMPAICGRDAFRSWVRPFFECFEYEFSLDASSVTIAGDRAVELGAFRTTMTPIDGGPPTSHGGSYLVMWRRADDGQWWIDRYVDGTYLHS